MKALLNEIIEHLKDTLPNLAAFFNPPATQEELRKAEEELGFSLPAEVRELYLIHNGEREGGPGLFFGLPFLSVEEMMAEWKIWVGLEEEYAFMGEHDSVPARWIKERYINRYWLPISRDWGGNHLGIDMDPDEFGQAGQVINFGRDEEVKYVIARSVTDLLRFIRDTAKQGNFSIHQEEDSLYWSFGREDNLHFLDAIRKLDLPVLDPVWEESAVKDAEGWLAGLDSVWRDRVLQRSGSAEAFLRAKRLLFINEGLTNIVPLGDCKEVRELVLSANEIRSIEPLRGCTQLKRLYLGKNPVSDLRPLQKLQHLRMLYVADTAVEDLSPLENLSSLQELRFPRAPIRDYSPLRQMPGLRAVEVSQPDREQLHILFGLPRIEKLTIAGLRDVTAKDLGQLGSLPNLRELELEDVCLENLAFLHNCRQLKQVKLVHSTVNDISALSRLESLTTLELNGCPDVGDVEELSRSTSLRKIAASYQQFSLLKDRFDRKIDFSTMTGNMTDEEKEIWYRYLRE